VIAQQYFKASKDELSEEKKQFYMPSFYLPRYKNMPL
jgi:hypothetical protein